MAKQRGKLGDITGAEAGEIREALGISQNIFRRRLGLSTVNQVSRWENGKDNPSVGLHAKLRKMAREAGVKLSCEG